MASETNEIELSEREQEILRLVATGASNKEIAQQLVISPNTVKVHLRNIFGKIGVASRTEATLYAIQHGYAPVPGAEGNAASPLEQATLPSEKAAPPPPRAAPRPYVRVQGIGVGLLAVIAAGLGAVLLAGRLAPTVSPEAATALAMTPAPRWQSAPEMPTARSGLGAVVYEGGLYAVAGEGANGPTGAVERYDLASKTWTTLASKPLPVADVQAAVIGGRVYVPGGRLASGAVSNVLEAYNPRADRWEQLRAMPVALSAYALAAFEGKLYVFGGWDGAAYVDTVLEYDPDQDTWRTRAPLPTARGFAGAAVAENRIHVIGGTDGTQRLANHEIFSPATDDQIEAAWLAGVPLPEGRSHLGVAAVADVIHVIGGESQTRSQPLYYNDQERVWQTFEPLLVAPVMRPGLAVEGTYLHLIGGSSAEKPSNQHATYQAIYLIPLPFLSP